MPRSETLTAPAPAGAADARARFWKLTWLDALFAGLALLALLRVFRDSEAYDEDFHVYWKAAHTWLAGGNPYAFTADDHGFVFKYPPWILPLFLPIGLLGWEGARHAWFGVELFCVFYAIRWCVRQGVGRHVAFFTACLFWWMLHAHFAAGQFTLVILLASLWAGPDRTRSRGGEAGGFKDGALAFVLSAKVFSLFTLAGAWRRFLRLKPWVVGASLFAGAHALLLLVSWRTGALQASPSGIGHALVDYYRGFAAAAASGGAELGAEIVRGQGNHGFSALVLRTLGVSSLSFASDAVTATGLAALLGALWQRASRALSDAERWAGWIGIALIVHPLAWHHSFVLAYPLCALSIGRALGSRKRGPALLSMLGACCIGIFIPQILGKTLVKPIELAGVKSWGVVLSGLALVLSARTEARKQAGDTA